MGLSLSPRVEQRLEMGHRLTMDQRFALRLELLQALGNGNYCPKAECPKCGHQLTDAEILQGFNRDPMDLTTKCPVKSCGERFRAHLTWRTNAGSVQLIFYCPTQTTHALGGKDFLKPTEIEKHDPSLYHSAVAHFGTLKSAFASIGVAYAFEERADWRDKVSSFLGQMPDVLIAECVGVSTSMIRRLRRAKGIKPFLGFPR